MAHDNCYDKIIHKILIRMWIYIMVSKFCQHIHRNVNIKLNQSSSPCESTLIGICFRDLTSNPRLVNCSQKLLRFIRFCIRFKQDQEPNVTGPKTPTRIILQTHGTKFRTFKLNWYHTSKN